ncbi:hypothetical protein BUALT_Bualt02G0102700 [Buddleja alternifolia]|uniref:Uncharacterized protein n=1 Tax=Buddleja alternifolia TaxID=168488 RepID=A0AAV6Y7N4_9LAMI|nr:hypothetical protein BUALT_Bualt02G0102700 [Buddleja alternifolia]
MNFLAWVLAFFYATFLLSSFALENPRILKSRDFLISSSNESSPSDVESPGDGRVKFLATEKKITFTWSEKGQRGNGAYGGSNIVHRRPAQKRNAAPLLLYRPAHFFTVFCFSLLFAFPLR